MAAPAAAASIDCCAMSAGVSGRCGDMLGVWIEPVAAQVMITLRLAAMCFLLLSACLEGAPPLRRRRARPAQIVSTLPHTLSAWPLMLRPPDEHRNSAMLAMSSGATMRRNDTLSRDCSRVAS